MWVAFVVVSSRVLITRFQDTLQVLLLIGRVEVQKPQIFEAPNKYFMSGKAKLGYIYTPMTFLVSVMGVTILAVQTISFLRAKVQKLVSEM